MLVSAGGSAPSPSLSVCEAVGEGEVILTSVDAGASAESVRVAEGSVDGASYRAASPPRTPKKAAANKALATARAAKQPTRYRLL